jgi:hypothetical protein
MTNLKGANKVEKKVQPITILKEAYKVEKKGSTYDKS